MQIFPTRMCNVTAWRHSKLRAHWLMALVAGAEGNCIVSYLSLAMVALEESVGVELKGGENSLHWKANMIPLFSIMTLWMLVTATYSQ